MASAENILISVEQKYVVSMLSGVKKIELRRRRLCVQAGTRIWIYSKAPHAVVAAVANIRMIVGAPPLRLWRQYGHLAGLTKIEFDLYFSHATTGWAIFLEDVFPLPTAITLATLRRRSAPFQPPQFFKRLQEGSKALSLLQSGIRTATSRIVQSSISAS